MAETPIIMDGHAHVTNRVYWEGLDPWEPQSFGFDYANAARAGVNVVVDNVAPYGYDNFDYTPKQTLRLTIVGQGRVAVILGVESGFDHEGGPDVLRAFHRLGVRVVQFTTQTCYNAFADAELHGDPVWHGINDHGRHLVEVMNELGILIDVTHASHPALAQLVAASDRPVVASHVAMAKVLDEPTGTGMVTDHELEAISDRGGMVCVIGVAADISVRYRRWASANHETAAAHAAPSVDLATFTASLTRAPLDHGEFGAWLDETMRREYLAGIAAPAEIDPQEPTPSPDEWAAHVDHVIRTVGPDHVGIGLDLAPSRNCVPRSAAGYATWSTQYARSPTRKTGTRTRR